MTGSRATSWSGAPDLARPAGYSATLAAAAASCNLGALLLQLGSSHSIGVAHRRLSAQRGRRRPTFRACGDIACGDCEPASASVLGSKAQGARGRRL